MSCYRYESLVREGKPIIQSFGQTQKFDDIMIYDKRLRFLPHRFSMIQTSIEEAKQKARTDFLQIVAAMGQSLNRCRRFICWKFVGIAP